MKTLFATASAVALMLSAAACSEPNDPMQTAGYETSGPVLAQNEPLQETDMQDQLREMDKADKAEMETADRQEYVLAQGEMEASDLIGAPVKDPADNELATVSDVWLGSNGMAPMLVIRDGGISGLGGELRTIGFDAVTITPNVETSGDEPKVLVQMSEDTLETLPAFEQEEKDDYRLASEMIGAVPSFSFNDEQGKINDLILNEKGEMVYAVVAPGLVTTEQLVISADAVMMTEGDGDGELVLNVDEPTFNSAKTYRWE